MNPAASHGATPVPARRAWTEVGKRVGVAVLVLPPVGWLIWRGGPWSAGLFGLGAAIAAWEYYRLALGPRDPAAWIGVATAAVLPLLPWAARGGDVGAALFVCLAAASMLAWGYHLARGPRAEAPVRVGHLLAGLLFSSVGLVALSALRMRPDGVAWTAAVLVGTWANDACAFFGGKALGRHKLMPKVSPGKTWEGFLCGLAGGAAALLLVRTLLLAPLGWLDGVVIALVAGTFGPVGDLCKSMLKRAYHVKDSGRLFPGHGGMLDRIDAVLFNAPVVLLYALARAAW
jgi:phosphatidate cytidylyltransferase